MFGYNSRLMLFRGFAEAVAFVEFPKRLQMERPDRVLRPRRGQPGDGAGDARNPPAAPAQEV